MTQAPSTKPPTRRPTMSTILTEPLNGPAAWTGRTLTYRFEGGRLRGT